MSGHQHVMARDNVGDAWYQCQFCDFGMFNFEMPDAPDVSIWAERADRPLADWQRMFLNSPKGYGKRAAYEEAVRTMEETIGPSQPLIAKDGREYGRFWDETFTARWDR